MLYVNSSLDERREPADRGSSFEEDGVKWRKLDAEVLAWAERRATAVRHKHGLEAAAQVKHRIAELRGKLEEKPFACSGCGTTQAIGYVVVETYWAAFGGRPESVTHDRYCYACWPAQRRDMEERRAEREAPPVLVEPKPEKKKPPKKPKRTDDYHA